LAALVLLASTGLAMTTALCSLACALQQKWYLWASKNMSSQCFWQPSSRQMARGSACLLIVAPGLRVLRMCAGQQNERYEQV
jgi:hypothetical protein